MSPTMDTQGTGPGVGAWKVPTTYRRGMVLPVEAYQNQRVRWAVVAIQQELIRRNYLGPVTVLDGAFGIKTDLAVRKFQHDAGTQADGIVGPKTARRLWLQQFQWWQAACDIPDNLLFGLAALESGMDPGAEGNVDRDDRGLFQFNRRAHPDISDFTAFSDVPWCVQRAASTMAGAYASLGAWDPAIAYWNNPALARQWATDGHPPTQQIGAYVDLVHRAAGAPL